MATVHVRDVPEDDLRTLKVRAAGAGQSLQSYLLQMIKSEASLLTPAEIAEEARSIAARGQVTADDITEAIADMREARR
ncbi:FitA-like ribbon-helix-helix domain-containing protein [Streptomyces sp. NPDC004838]